MSSIEKDTNQKDTLGVYLKRVPSVGAVESAADNLNWERSQSDINLTQRKEKGDRKSTQVSDNCTVYWDLSKTEENSKANAHGFQMALETIHQNDELLENYSGRESFTSSYSEDATDIEIKYENSENHHRTKSYQFSSELSSLDRYDKSRVKRNINEVETRKSCSALPIMRRQSSGVSGTDGGGLIPQPLPKKNDAAAAAGAAEGVSENPVVENNVQKQCKNSYSNYFCDTDYDANKECIPNYQVKLKVIQDELMESVMKLEVDPESHFQWPSSEQIELKVKAINDCLQTVSKAWAIPKMGRDIATNLCDLIRQQGLLGYLTECIASMGEVIKSRSSKSSSFTEDDLERLQRKEFMLKSAQLFSQILTQENIDSILGISSGSSTPKVDQINDYADFDNSSESTQLFKRLIRQSWKVRGDKELNQAFICILEGLLKHHKKTNRLIVRSGGLDTMVYSCRSTDTETLKHLALALVNLALFGDFEIHCTMVELKVADWLFPLAFHDNDVVKYYACLAIVILSSHRELAQVLYSSGTIELVSSFLQTHSPYEFSEIEPSHLQGRSKIWLDHLLPILKSDSFEAVSLASFHFVMEARIKQKQNKTSIFYEIGAIEVLKKVASSTFRIAAEFCRQALKILHENLPYSLSHPVSLWTVEDVCNWLKEVSFEDLREKFIELKIDGDILLSFTDEVIINGLGISNQITRLRLIREITKLKLQTVYQPCDPTGVGDWIRKHVGPEYVQYTYCLIKAGVDRKYLSHVTESMLENDCNIKNSIHRSRLINAISDCKVKFAKDTKYAMSVYSEGQGSGGTGQMNSGGGGGGIHAMSSSHTPGAHPSGGGGGGAGPTGVHPSAGLSQEENAAADITANIPSAGGLHGLAEQCIVSNHADDSQFLEPIMKNIDVFISYRRLNGSQLASLLMVHLRLRGYRVFLDIERLPAGKFNENLLQSIQRARNFILVLTSNALDRCFEDVDKKDWMHREIACALQNGCNIIPVIDRFEFPPEEKLPIDMRSVLNYNAVAWVHDYQDACIEKIEQFMSDYNQCVCPFSPPQIRSLPTGTLKTPVHHNVSISIEFDPNCEEDIIQ